MPHTPPSPQQPASLPRQRVLTVALWGLAAWALALSIEALFRQPGRADLPAQLVRRGRVYRALPAPPPPGPLPDGLVLRAASDYAAAQVDSLSSPELIRLRRVALLQTGRSVVIPVERLGQLLVGEGVEGQCVELDAAGVPLQAWGTTAAWRAERDARRSSWGHRLVWLAGLRPFADNSCLWESGPAAAAQQSQ